MQPDKPFNYWQNDRTSDDTTISPPVPAVPTPAPISSQPVDIAISHEPSDKPMVTQPVVAQAVVAPAPPQPIAPPQPQSFDVVANHEPVELTHDLRPSTPEPMPMYAPTPVVAEPEPDTMPEDNQFDNEPDDIDTDLSDTVHWSATEYAYREKNGLWFTIFAIIVLGLIAVDIFFLKTYTFSALVAVMAAAVIVYYKRPPQEINYTLSPDHGLYVGETLRTYDEFKSFAVINDNGSNFIMLVPLKRFSPGLSVYFPAEFGEQIVDVLGQRLPMEERKLDLFDVIVRKLRI